MKAYYFSTIGKTLRYGDGRVIEEGITHTVEGTPLLCEHGFHASKRAIDALLYAPGSFLWIVELSGEIVEGDDKVVATERTYIKGFNATNILREFSRKVALINIEKIKPYCFVEDFDIIIRYLETGDEELMDAAMDTAKAAAWSAWSAAEFVAEFAAWSAAWSADRTVAEYALLSGAESSARAAARAAARAVSESAAWSAVRSADSADSAEWSAAAALSAARSDMNETLEEMIEEELKEH